MADNKEYISTTEEGGSIRISEDVIASIASAAAQEVPGVRSTAGKLGNDIAEFIGKKVSGKGVRVQMDGDAMTVEISILVRYGDPVTEVAQKVQDAVLTNVSDMTGFQVSAVNVYVGGIYFEKEGKKNS